MNIGISILVLFGCQAFPGDELAPIWAANHQWQATSVAFSPDGKILAAGAAFNGIVLWDGKTGREISRINGAHVGGHIAFSPDNKTLASTANWQQGEAGAVVRLWDVASGKLRGQFKGDENLIRCATFSPDGNLLAGHSQWGKVHVGAVWVWEMGTRKELLHIATNSAGHTVVFSPDGKLLAFDVEYTIRLCQISTGNEVLKLEGHQEVKSNGGITSGYLNALAFSPDGKLLASASCDNSGRIWDLATGKTLQVLEGHRGFVNTVAFFPDGKTVATGGEDGTIRCWRVTSGRQLNKIQAHTIGQQQGRDRRKDVFAISFSPDGKTLASCGRDAAIKVWDVGSVLGKQQP